MSNPRQELQAEYASTLGGDLARAREASLLHAQELGRKALGDGLGVLDIVMLYHEALAAAGGNGSALSREKLERAAEFLAESLAPFEMSLRGYREANVHLTAMNERLRQATAAIEAANRELEAFSYSVAHDLRAPLRGIDGFSQALLEDYAEKLDEEGKQYLRYLCQSAQLMGELVDGLLSLARVSRSELHREPLDLAGLAGPVLSQLRRSEADRSIETVVPPSVPAEGDRRLLRVVLENLLGNSWKFTRGRGPARIELGTESRDGRCVYFIRDNGAGFDMAYAGKLFGAFQRLHSTSEFEGTGIGLATVQRIIARHCGRIWAEAKVGQGATFYFTLWDAGGR
jgi:light-regulated signal transduction histidine kinase (bacteriophytochrome)